MSVKAHRLPRAYEVYVGAAPKREALKRLHERMAAGESPYKILEISEMHSYYVNKVVQGHCPISYALYGRIMNLDEEDAFDV